MRFQCVLHCACVDVIRIMYISFLPPPTHCPPQTPSLFIDAFCSSEMVVPSLLSSLRWLDGDGRGLLEEKLSIA